MPNDFFQSNKPVIREFEEKVAAFFGAPYAVATDSCTHGIELCLRLTRTPYMLSPTRTYLSIPMLATKLGIPLIWNHSEWEDYYEVGNGIIDAAVLEGFLSSRLYDVSLLPVSETSLARSRRNDSSRQ